MPGQTGAIKRLIVGMDVLTGRDLVGNPPGDNETMQQLGLGASTIDLSMRRWINNKFMEPAGKPFILPGKIKLTTKFSELKTMILGKDA